MSIQSETYSPEHMRSEKEGWTKWVIGTIALGIFTFCVLIAVSPLIYWASETTFNQNSWAEASAYLARIGEPNFIAEAHNALWHLHWKAGMTVAGTSLLRPFLDRKRVVSGKGVSVRVVLGSSCIIKQKKSTQKKK